MTWDLKSDRPIYTQLVEQIKLNIVSGVFKAGDRLPTVRELAAEAAVNPNTMQKALAELEQSGLVYSQRTTGRFITEDLEMINKEKEQIAKDEIVEFLEKMAKLGLDKDSTVSMIEKIVKEMK